MMGKGIVIFLVIFLLIILAGLIVGGIYYSAIFGRENYDSVYQEKIDAGVLVNPTLNLTLDEAIEQFDENFVYYILYSIKAYNLYSPPFSKELPKINFYIDEDVYSATIKKGEINVRNRGVDDGDIGIYTSREEVVKMMKNEIYVKESFAYGLTAIVPIAGKAELASKGYLKIYEELTGEDSSSLNDRNI
jgi:hypothetical protein